MLGPTLIVYCGLPGVGKSVASDYTAKRLSAPRYRSDEIRKQLFPDPSYTTEETVATYEELLAHGRSDLAGGSTVVLDATFRSKRFRDRAATVARETGASTQFVHVTCDIDVVEDRIADRSGAISDAAFEQHLQLRAEFEPIGRDHVVIDNSGSIEATFEQIDRELL